MTDLFARKSASRGRDRTHDTVSATAGRIAKNAMHTLPILLAGTMAMSLNMTAPLDSTASNHDDKPKDSNQELRNVLATAMNAAANERAKSGTRATSAIGSLVVTAVASAPTSYRVVSGDTVSSIATSYGLSTASVLALNGLGWNSLIFPGQVLQLTSAPVTPPSAVTPPSSTDSSTTSHIEYTISSGDTISAIASRFGVSTQAVLTANRLGWSTIIYPGQSIVIPGVEAPAATDSTPPPLVDIAPVANVVPLPENTAPQTTSYLIISGDNITSIAATFGVSVQAILDANGLNRSSIIYAGRTLTIPQVTSAPAGMGTTITPLTAEMAANARTIIAVGTSLGVSDYGLVIALSAAMQESTLRNLNYGDLDSLGLFQQRPSTGWGTPAQVTDPEHASRLFFGGPNNPNQGTTRGLLDISGWQSMTVTDAAQAVQISGHPDAYAKWETSARSWLSQLR